MAEGIFVKSKIDRMKVEIGVFKRGVSPSFNILLPFGKDKEGEVIKYSLPTHPPRIVFDYAS